MRNIDNYVAKVLEAFDQCDGASTIGINGLDCAGKTTLAQLLQQQLLANGVHAELMHVDDFNDLSVQKRVYSAYCDDKLTKDLFEQYYHSSVDYVALQDAIQAAGERKSSPIIVEGVFLYRPSLADLFDVKVFLTVPYEVARKRYAARKAQAGDDRPIQVFDDIWVPAYERYCRDFSPEKAADLVFEM